MGDIRRHAARADGAAPRLGQKNAVRLWWSLPHGQRQDRRVVDHLGQHDDPSTARPYAEQLNLNGASADQARSLSSTPSLSSATTEASASRTARLSTCSGVTSFG